ncbi:MAG: hypothetical protein ACRDPO_32410, partial [Streptosporangiaceae bacterium]
PHENQAHKAAEGFHTDEATRIPRRLELYNPCAEQMSSFIPPPGSQANTTAGMGNGTSPAIAGLSGGGYEVTFQDNT